MNYQLSRRSFINAAAATILTQMVAGCGRSSAVDQILFLESSIPPQLINDFRRAIKQKSNLLGKVKFQPQPQLAQIFSLLSSWQQNEQTKQDRRKLLDKVLGRAAAYPSLITLGDIWLAPAIKQNLIHPINVQELPNWQELPSTWQNLVRRNNQGDLTQDGEVWGAPYRWGCTVIAYQSEELSKRGLKLEDWQDLWQPELQGHISLLDSPRETIGLTLKSLGHSYNTSNLNKLSNLESALLDLHQQTKIYSSNHYLKPLILKDTWAAVGWSTDIIPLAKRYPTIKFIIPSSGTSLWADTWVKPKISTVIKNEATDSKINVDFQAIIAAWIDFCWQPKAAKQISLFTESISPILLSMKTAELTQDLQNNYLLNQEILRSEQSEFLLPLQPSAEQQYRELWLKVRQSG